MPRRLLTLLLYALLAFPAPLAWGQATDFQDALSGAKYPLTLTTTNLDSSWRGVSVSAPSRPSVASPQNSVLADSDQPSYYLTKGQTVSVGSETFLVAYLVPTRYFVLPYLNDRASVSEELAREAKRDPRGLYKLSLLNVRQIGSLDSVVAFTPETAEEARAREQDASSEASLNNLKQIGLGMIQYVQDYDEKLPPMKSAAVAKAAIYPYVKSDAVFRQPRTHEPYLPNTSLSHRTLASFNDPSGMVTYYEASPAPDGKRAVLFLDGHVKRVDSTEWQRLKTASHVPNPR